METKFKLLKNHLDLGHYFLGDAVGLHGIQTFKEVNPEPQYVCHLVQGDFLYIAVAEVWSVALQLVRGTVLGRLMYTSNIQIHIFNT